MKRQNFKKISLNIDISKIYHKLSKKNIRALYVTIFITCICAFINLSIGASNSNLFELTTNALLNNDFYSYTILINLRLPHVLCSLLAGAILGICGCVLQSSLGNPLASPSTIGISQGSACGACIAIVLICSVFGQSQLLIIVSAFIFAVIPTLIIYSISKFKQLYGQSIILTGVALSIFFAGVIAIIEYFADSSKVSEVVFWTFGSVTNINYIQLLIMLICLIFIVLYCVFNGINFNALECGDMTAHSVGINIKNSRLIHLIISSICIACVTSFCGTINFIGLMAPHIMRKFVSSNYKFLCPASAVCGACLLTISDIFSSIILPGVILPIGAITSLIGAPIFIWILLKRYK